MSQITLPLLCLYLGFTAACSGPLLGTPHATELKSGTKVKVAARTYTIKTPDGKPLGNATVTIAGQRVSLEKGIPINLARVAASKGAVLEAPGFVPVKLQPGSGEVDVVLVPTTPLGAPQPLAIAGGTISAPDAGLQVDIPSGLAGAQGGDVSLEAYFPILSGQTAKTVPTETANLFKTMGLPAPAACQDEAPLPCPPVVASLGLLVRLDGVLKTGPLAVRWDLTKLLRGWNGLAPEPWLAAPGDWTDAQRQSAAAAARILKTFANIDQQPNAAAWRNGIKTQFGLSLEGQLLKADLNLGATSFSDGFTTIQVFGSALLGALIEVTVVGDAPSRTTTPTETTLPPVVSGTRTPPPNPLENPDPSGICLAALQAYADVTGKKLEDLLDGQIAPKNPLSSLAGFKLTDSFGGSLISDQGGRVVSNVGGRLISDQGGELISNNGGSFVITARPPIAQLGAKYRLKAFEDYDWFGLRGRVATSQDVTSPFYDDVSGTIIIPKVPVSGRLVYVQVLGSHDAFSAPFGLWAIAPCPGCKTTEVHVDAATTALSMLVQDEVVLRDGSLDDVDYAAYDKDVKDLKKEMNQEEAISVVSGERHDAAEVARRVFTRLGRLPACLPTAKVVTLAGTSNFGSADGTGSNASFKGPSGVAVRGNTLYVADRDNNRVRMVDLNGKVDTLGTTGAPFNGPRDLAFAGDYMYVLNAGNATVTRVNLNTRVSEVWAGRDGSEGFKDGTRGDARFTLIAGCVAAANGTLYIADRNNAAIRRISPTGVVDTIAGVGGQPGFADGPRGTSRLDGPFDICFGPGNDLYVADFNRHNIRRIDLQDPQFRVTTVLGRGVAGFANGGRAYALFAGPSGIASDDKGNLFVSEYSGGRIRMIRHAETDNPDVISIAGGSNQKVLQDGVGLGAIFERPRSMVQAPDGRIIVADRDNHAIRALTLSP